MPRRRSPSNRKRITQITEPSHGKIEIYYHPDRKEFQATVGDEDVWAPTQAEVEKLARQLARERTNLDWKPCIEVNLGHSWGRPHWAKDEPEETAEIDLEYDRFYYAHRADGTLRKSRWQHAHDYGLDEDELDIDQPTTQFYRNWMGKHEPWIGEDFYWDEKDDGVFAPPCSHDGRAVFFIPYTVEAWRGLQAVEQAIKALRGRLRQLLTTDAGIEQLKKATFNLLEAPKRKK